MTMDAQAGYQSNRRRVRWFFAGLLVAIGIFDVFGAVVAHDPLRDLELQSLVPTAFSLLGRTAVVIAGLSLLLLARGMARGKRIAWELTCAILAVSVVLHLVKSLDVEGAVFAAWLLLGLWWLREYFQAESDRTAMARGAVSLAAGLALALGYALAGSWLLRHELQPGFGVRRTITHVSGGLVHVATAYQPTTMRAAWFVGTMPWVAGVLVLIGLVQLLRPTLAPVADRLDRARLRRLLLAVGHNPIAYLALGPRLNYFWAAEDACAGYRLAGRIAICLGDPIAPPGRLDQAVAAFTRHCDAQDWTAAFYQVESRSAYERLGYLVVPVGADAVVDTAAFDLAGKARADLRYAVKRCEREGVSFTFTGGDEALRAAGQEIRDLSARWLARDKGPEMAFSLGTVESLDDPEIVVGIARSSAGRVEAIISLLPTTGRSGWTLDLMRRQPDAVYGVMEALIVRAVEEARGRGLREVSLGLAPVGLDSHAEPEQRRALRIAYSGVARFQRSRSLHHFKSKFGPRWETRYLAVEQATLLPEVLLALARVHLPPLSPQVLRLRLGGGRLAAA